MSENIITWNFANWVTVVLMAAIGFMALGALVSFAKKRGMGSDSDSQ
jgi:hypothetical protein